MKGISHFMTGVAIATLFPDAVHAAANGSFILVLGGIGGLLPDTLDFKFARFVEEPDILIEPHADRFDAQKIAEVIAAGVDYVGETHKKQILKCNTIRLGTDWWRQYEIQFDAANGQVNVQGGPIVNTSQMPLPQSQDPTSRGRAKMHTTLLSTYSEYTTVDIFGGPSMSLEWRNNRVEIDFLPWHRQYSHSLFMALLFGALCWVLFGVTAGLIGFGAVVGHVVEDQLGYLGSNLLWPLTRVRSNGLKWIHAGDAIPNFFTVGTMVYVIVFELDRFASKPIFDPLLFWGIFWLPFPLMLVFFFYQKFVSERTSARGVFEQQQADLIAETQEVVDA